MTTKKRASRTRRLGIPGILAVTLIATAVIGVRGATPLLRPRLSDDLLQLKTRPRSGVVRLILPGSSTEVDALVGRHRLKLLRRLSEGAVVQVTAAQLEALSVESGVPSLSGDSLVAPDMTISNQSTQADRARTGSGGLLGIGAIPGVTGQGVGVAVIDSGISPHSALAGKRRRQRQLRHRRPAGRRRLRPRHARRRHHRRERRARLRPSPTLTRAASRRACTWSTSASSARQASGYTSDVIAGIDWVIANRARYNIRVINLSLGHPVMEPAATDPLCQAVARAAAAGIVVVASPGNDGQISRRPHDARRHHLAGQLAVRHHRGRAEHLGHGRTDPTTRWPSTARAGRPRST